MLGDPVTHFGQVPSESQFTHLWKVYLFCPSKAIRFKTLSEHHLGFWNLKRDRIFEKDKAERGQAEDSGDWDFRGLSCNLDVTILLPKLGWSTPLSSKKKKTKPKTKMKTNIQTKNLILILRRRRG